MQFTLHDLPGSSPSMDVRVRSQDRVGRDRLHILLDVASAVDDPGVNQAHVDLLPCEALALAAALEQSAREALRLERVNPAPGRMEG